MAVGVRSATPRSPLPVRTMPAGPALARGGVPRTKRGAAEAGRRAPTRPPGDVWCPDEDKHTGRGPALDAHAPGPRPSTPTPQTLRRGGGEASRVRSLAHLFAYRLRVDDDVPGPRQLLGFESKRNAPSYERPPRMGQPPARRTEYGLSALRLPEHAPPRPERERPAPRLPAGLCTPTLPLHWGHTSRGPPPLRAEPGRPHGWELRASFRGPLWLKDSPVALAKLPETCEGPRLSSAPVT